MAIDIPLLGFGIPTWIVLCGTSVALYWIMHKRRHEAAMKKIGVKGPMPYPVLGTFYQQMKKGQVQADLDNIKEYGKIHLGKVGGRNTIVVADAEMLKQILVKQFQYFTNRRKFTGFADKPLDKMMTVVDDEEWKNIRNASTPAFSGGKLRKMTSHINHCAKIYASNLATYADKDEAFEVKKLSGSFSADVIARVAFGIEIDSQNDPEHPFVKYMMDLLDFSFKKRPALLVAMFFPFLAKPLKKMGMTFMSKEALNYFVSVVEQAIEARKDDTADRNDFLQLMLDGMHKTADENSAPDSQKKPLTFNEVISNCVIFFFAAFGTIGDSMCFTLYCLAKYSEMQTKIYEEIQTVLGDKDSCSYDDVKAMTYLDMFMQEVLRLHSTAMIIDRECSEEVTIDGVTFPKDSVVVVPVQAIHMDPEYWPEPEKFDPERFSPENKADINPVHWLPFGSGPRNCIGLRLALVEIKIALVHLIRSYEIKLTSPDQELKRNQLTGASEKLTLKVAKR